MLTLRNLLFAIIITTSFFVILEAGYRLIYAYRHQDPAFLFYGKTLIEFKIKKFNNRVRDICAGKIKKPAAKDENKVIWTFGGSTTKCTPYVKEADSWPNKLEFYLNKKSNGSFTVVNKAVAGGTYASNIALYENSLFVNERVPDIAIFYGGLNDSTSIIYAPQKLLESERLKISLWDTLNCRLMEMSLLYASTKEFICKSIYGDINAAWKLKKRDMPADITQLDKNIDKLTSVSRCFDITLIICSEPISIGYWKRSPNQESVFNSVVLAMRKGAEKNNVAFVDVNSDIFLKYPQFEKCFVDGVHLNEHGNDIVAEYLINYMNDKGYLQ